MAEPVQQSSGQQSAAPSSAAAPPTQDTTSVSPHTSEGNVEHTGHTADALDDETRELLAEIGQLTISGKIDKESLREIINAAEQGRSPVIKTDSKYREQKSSPNVRDVSQAGRIIKPKTHEAALQIAEDMCDYAMEGKDRRVPSGIYLSDGNPAISMVETTEQGRERPVNQYEEPEQYTKTGRTLGEGKYAAIYECEDKKTGQRHALKMVKMPQFNKHELKLWVNVANNNKFVKLLLAKNNGDRMDYHMTLVNGVTLRALVENHIQNLDHANRRLLSLYIFWSLLDALICLHKIDSEGMKGACHGDIHSENVMLDRTTLEIKVLDFGNASPLNRGRPDFHHDGLKSDVLNIVRIFCFLYIDQEFRDIFHTYDVLVLLEKEGTAKDIDDQCRGFLPNSKNELKRLLKEAHTIVADKKQPGYSDVQRTKQEVQKCLEEQVKRETGAVSGVPSLLPKMKEIAAKLFPAEDAEASGGIDMSDDQSQAPAPDAAGPSPQPTVAEGVKIRPAAADGTTKSKKPEGKQASSRK